LNYCFQAGPEKCPLYTGNSSLDIGKRIDDFLADISENPISVSKSDSRGPEIITYEDVISDLGFRRAFYSPDQQAEILFQDLHYLMNGNASNFADKKQEMVDFNSLTERCKGADLEHCIRHLDVATFGVLCMDGVSIVNETKKDFAEIVRTLHGQSKFFSTFWSQIRMSCNGWKVRPACV